jgi:hypothetical protein
MDDTPRQMRVGTVVRGVIIGALIAVYSWVMELSGSWAELLIVAAAVQFALIIARRFVPADRMPQAMYIIEMIADGVTVLLFAVGVLGGSISRMPEGV